MLHSRQRIKVAKGAPKSAEPTTKISAALKAKRVRYQKEKQEEDAFFWPDRKFLESEFLSEKFCSLIAHQLSGVEALKKGQIPWAPTSTSGASEGLSYYNCLAQVRLQLLQRQKELFQRAAVRQQTWPADALVLPTEETPAVKLASSAEGAQEAAAACHVSDFVIMSIQTLLELIKESLSLSPELCNGAIDVMAQTFGSMLPQTLLANTNSVIDQVEAYFASLLDATKPLPGCINRSSCLSVLLNLAIARGSLDSIYRAIDVVLKLHSISPIDHLPVNPGLNLLTSCRLPSSFDPVGIVDSFALAPSISCATDAPFAVATDGAHLYLHCSAAGILKIGTGYQSTTRGALVASLPSVGAGSSRSWLGVGLPSLLFYRDDSMAPGTLLVFNSNDLSQPPQQLLEAPVVPSPQEDETVFAEFSSLGQIAEQPGLLFVYPDTSLKATLLGFGQIKERNLLIRFFEVDTAQSRILPLLARGITSIPVGSRDDDRAAVLGTTPYDPTIPPHFLPRVGVDAPPKIDRLITYNGIEQLTFASGTPEFTVLLTQNGASYFVGDCSKLAALKSSKSSTPKKLYPSLSLQAVYTAPEANHALLLTRAGKLHSVGQAARGCLGHGNKENLSSPKLIAALKDRDIVSAAVGLTSSVAITDAGLVYAWGTAPPSGTSWGGKSPHSRPVDITSSFEFGTSKPVQAFHCSGATFILTDRGELFSWGHRNTGHGSEPAAAPASSSASLDSPSAPAGLLSSVDSQPRPDADAPAVEPSGASSSSSSHSNRLVVNSPRKISWLGASTVRSLACGKDHVLALAQNPDGTSSVYAWGESKNGSLGLGELTTAPIPTRIDLLTELRPTKVAAGADHSVVLTSDGSVFGFGSNAANQLGISEAQTSIPLPVVTVLHATDIFAFDLRTVIVGSPFAPVVEEQRVLPKSSLFSDGQTVGLVLPHDGFVFVEPESGEATPSSVIAASSSSAASPPPQFNFFVRVFALNTSTHVGDLPVLAVGDLEQPALALDLENRSYWRLNSVSPLNVELLQHIVEDQDHSRPYAPTMVLRDPRVAVPGGLSATATPLQTSTALLASIDASSTAIETVSSSGSASSALPTNLEPSCVNRFSRVADINWGYSGSQDAISFSVSDPIYVLGFGLYTGNSSSTAQISIREPGAATDISTPTSGSIVSSGTAPCPIWFDSWIYIAPSRNYTAIALITGDQTHSGNEGKTSLLVDGVAFTFSGADGSTNGTSTSSGQIPCIYFVTVEAIEAAKRKQLQALASPRFIPKPELHTGISQSGVTGLISILQWAWGELLRLLSSSEDPEDIICPISISLSCFRTINRNILHESIKPHLGALADFFHGLFRSPLFVIAQKRPRYRPLAFVIQEACQTYEASFLSFFADSPSQAFVLLTLARYVRSQGSWPANLPGAGALLQAVAHLLSITQSFSFALANCSPNEFPASFPAYSRGFFTTLIEEAADAPRTLPVGPGNLLLRQFSNDLARKEKGKGKDKDKDKGKDKGKDKVPEEKFERVFTDTLLYLSTASSEFPSVIDILLRSQTSLLREISSQSVGTSTTSNVVHKVSRFQSCSGEWGYGSTPDAISFTVSSPVTIVGMALWGGGGSYTAVLGIHPGDNEATPALITSEVSYDGPSEEPIEVRFEEPLLLEPDTLYTASALITGSNSTSGNNGERAVTDDNGILWSFSSSVGRTNGTSTESGQIPCLLYTLPDEPKPDEVDTEKSSGTIQKLVDTLLPVFQKNDALFAAIAQDPEISSDQVAACFNSPYFHSYLPLLFNQLLAVSDEMLIARALLPYLTSSTTHLNSINQLFFDVTADSLEQSADHQFVLQSSHPYEAPSRLLRRVAFPDTVEFMTVEFDPRCATSQPEDCLIIYTNDSYATEIIHSFHGGAGGAHWPVAPLVVPGRELVFEFQTATDYVKADNSQKFGYLCRVAGHAPPAPAPSYSFQLLKAFGYISASFAACILKSSFGTPSPPAKTPAVLRRGLKHCESTEKDLSQEFLSDFTSLVASETPGSRLARWLEDSVPKDLASEPDSNAFSISQASRSLFAATLWHLQLVDDARTVATYLRFHQTKVNMPPVLSLLHKLWNTVLSEVNKAHQHVDTLSLVLGLDSLFDAEQPASSSIEIDAVPSPPPPPSSEVDASSSSPSSSSSSSSAAEADANTISSSATPNPPLTLLGTRIIQNANILLRLNPLQAVPNAAAAGPSAKQLADRASLRASISVVPTPASSSSGVVEQEQSAHQKARAFLRSSLASIPSSSGPGDSDSFSPEEAASSSSQGPTHKRRGSAERVFPADSPTKSEAPVKDDRFKLLNNPSRQLYHAADSPTFKQIIEFATQNEDWKVLGHSLDASRTCAISRRQGLEEFGMLLTKLSQNPCIDDILWFLSSALHSNPVQDAKVPQGWNGGSVGSHYLAGLELSGAGLRDELRQVAYGVYRTISELLRPGRKVASLTRLLAMKVWTVKWLPEDHGFLHDCKIFPLIRTTMSVPKQNPDLETLSGYSLCASPDITSQGDLSASSSGGMLPSLVDASTETFWESADSNSGSPKYIDIAFPSETYVQDISLHIDNIRDKEQSVSKLAAFTGAAADSLPEKPSAEIAVRQNSTRCWNTLAIKSKVKFIRVLFTSKGGNARARLISITGAPKPNALAEAIRVKKSSEEEKSSADATLSPLDAKVSDNALLLFRFLTSQVFGGLMNPEQNEKPGVSLQEHLVGLLFIDEKRGLSEVQREVFHNLFVEIQRESLRLRYGQQAVSMRSSMNSDFTFGESPAASSSSSSSQDKGKDKISADDKGKGPAIKSDDAATSIETVDSSPDEYCFELVSIALALSVSETGQKFISNPSAIATLLTLLHSSTPRIQRQIVAICQRVLPHLSPDDLQSAFGEHSTLIQERGVIFFLFLCIAKSLAVQLRGRITGPQVSFDTSLDIVGEQLVGGPWLPGSVPPEIAPTLIGLVHNLENHPSWSGALTDFLVDSLFQLKDIQTRGVSNCSQLPTLWIALATLMIVGKSNERAVALAQQTMDKFTDTGSFVPSLLSPDNEPKYCDNHDDKKTHASIFCSSCKMSLCVHCDRILHLHRKNSDHFRNSMGVHEQSFSVDVHEGCSRSKMNSLLIVVDSQRCKAVVNFRQEPTATSCRFCGMRVPMERKTPYIPDSPALALVCEDELCLERAKMSCTRTHPCSHPCGGVRGEKQCLPCLRQCNPPTDGSGPLTQDHEDLCVTCWTDPLEAAPTIRLKCGHLFHYECTKQILLNKWNGARITFNFLLCPICRKQQISHPSLEAELAPLIELYEDVKRKSIQRVEYMGLQNSEDVTTEGGQFFGDLQGYALDRLCYYPCYKCKKPYFGGLRDCVRQAGNSSTFDPTELVCGACSASAGGGEICAKHGRDYLEFKCRFCCSIALWFCFGTTHFCDPCHNDHSRLCSTKKEDFPQCPVGPRAEKLDGDECPLKIVHPPTGEEFAMGCGICRNASTF